MKLLKNRILYDSSKGADKIIEVETEIGQRILLRGKHGHFFELFKDGNSKKIIPVELAEAYDFCMIHKDKFQPRQFDRLAILYFKEFVPVEKKKIDIPIHARQIGSFDGEELWFHSGDRFILKTVDETKIITKHQALDYVEKFQDRFRDLDRILKNIFPTTYRRP